MPELKDNQILLATDDMELWHGLLNAKIEGVEVTGIKKYDGSSLQDLIITLAPFVPLASTALTALAKWIRNYLAKNPTKKTTINERPITDDLDETIIILKQELKIHTRTTNKRKE